MDNITEIKAELDNLYNQYKKNKSSLNSAQKNKAASLLKTLFQKGNTKDAAAELARFSADVVNSFFESLTKSNTITIELLDELLKEWYYTDKDPKMSQYYVQKYVYAVTSIMKNYQDKALKSTQLPYHIVFIAKFAVKSEKHKGKFQTLINNTMAGIFMLDYSNISKNSLAYIWNAAKALYPDLSAAKYESIITEWAVKYDFINSPAPKVPVLNNKTEKNDEPAKDNNTDAVKISVESGQTSGGHDTEEQSNSNTFSDNSSAQILYEKLKTDMDKEQEAIITAFTDMITPLGKAFELIQGEINKSRELGIENTTLKAKNAELEHQIAEMRTRLQENSQSLSSAKAENSDLKQQVASLESKIAELDSKLNDAYSINSRESSLEAEKVRLELKKAFSFLYEDWLEYEFSDVSEENYESLQAIIKKIFRSLERNGIDFKESN